jgi:hypothetical protein
MRNDRRLETLAVKIRDAEKQNVASIVAIGGWLARAEELCEHGTFMDWVSANFGWSYRTCVRYRAAHRLAQNCSRGKFRKLNISVSALYALADLHDAAIRNAVIDRAAASRERLTVQSVRSIIWDLERPQHDPSDDSVDQDQPDSDADTDADDGADKQGASDGGGDTDDRRDDPDAGTHHGDERDGEVDDEDEGEIEDGRWARAFRASVSELQEALLTAPGEKALSQAVDLVGPETLRLLASHLQQLVHHREVSDGTSKADEALRARVDRAAATSEQRRKKA